MQTAIKVREDRIRKIETKRDKAIGKTKAKARSQIERLRRRARRDDTRRKVLAGAMLLVKVVQGDYSKDLLQSQLDDYLKRDTERVLFGLPIAADDGAPSRRGRNEKTEDTRRKLLVGAWVLEQVRSGKYGEDSFSDLMNEFLTHDKDRALFDLLPRRQQSVGETQPAQVGNENPVT